MSTATLRPGVNVDTSALLTRLTTATANTARGQRIRELLAQLDENAADQVMARRFDPETARGWIADLHADRAAIWNQIQRLATAPTDKETP